MADTFTITYAATPDPADLALVRAGLEAFNRAHVEADNYQLFALFVRDTRGALAGGLLGATYWGWLYVDILWLAEPARRQGYGSRLLAMAEQAAIARGCHGAHVDTMDFQALPFYERHGYSVFGVLDDMPRGHRRFFLKKALA